eukprot:m.30310 g.30310  ORF g.30310 m.30310 type:complete len:245 (+) comp10553_c0_seq1:209-943(+)
MSKTKQNKQNKTGVPATAVPSAVTAISAIQIADMARNTVVNAPQANSADVPRRKHRRSTSADAAAATGAVSATLEGELHMASAATHEAATTPLSTSPTADTAEPTSNIASAATSSTATTKVAASALKIRKPRRRYEGPERRLKKFVRAHRSAIVDGHSHLWCGRWEGLLTSPMLATYMEAVMRSCPESTRDEVERAIYEHHKSDKDQLRKMQRENRVIGRNTESTPLSALSMDTLMQMRNHRSV